MAYATTPEQEAVLASGQRSINNPEGGFEVPAAGKGYHLLHPGTGNAIRLGLLNFLQQIANGSGDAQAFRRIYAYTPIITEDDETPPLDFVAVEMLPFILKNGLRDVYLAFQETEEPDVYRLVGIYSTRKGEKVGAASGMFYNAATGLTSGENGYGLFSSGFAYSVDREMVLTTPNGWNRKLGFNVLFDMAAPLLLFCLDTRRFPFSYQGRDWQIQIWKGFYAVASGAEIGLYERPADRPFHYDASNTELEMTMQVYLGDKLYAEFGPERTWWAGAFSYASPICEQLPPGQVRLTGTILFEEQGMLDAFLISFEKNKPANMTGGAQGLLFSFDWKAR